MSAFWPEFKATLLVDQDILCSLCHAPNVLCWSLCVYFVFVVHFFVTSFLMLLLMLYLFSCRHVEIRFIGVVFLLCLLPLWRCGQMVEKIFLCCNIPISVLCKNISNVSGAWGLVEGVSICWEELCPFCCPGSADYRFKSHCNDFKTWTVSTIPMQVGFSKVVNVYDLYHFDLSSCNILTLRGVTVQSSAILNSHSQGYQVE